MPTELTPSDFQRYSRHLVLPDFGIEGQMKLKSSSVLVVGTGGLGAPLLQYLVAAGVGRIGLIDFDTIDQSNLQRQVLFTTADIGKRKTTVAAQRLKAQNPLIEIVPYHLMLNSENALDIIKDYDVVADGTDNFPTRYLVNDACVLLDKVNVYASIFRFEGQVSVFNYLGEDGNRGPNYRDIFPEPPPPGMVPSCAEGGVLGVLPGIIGSLQANEVIKVVTGVGQPLSGRLFLFDAATFDTRVLNIQKSDTNPLTGLNPTQKGLIDYDAFCGLTGSEPAHEYTLQEITVKELKAWRDQEKDHQLIDVRKDFEIAISNIGAEHILQEEVEQNIDRIRKDIPVVVHCRSGKRSGDVIEILEKKYGFQNLYNLVGGVLAWSEEIDPTLPKY
jgi:adenylyltransferase/sulfurtransferase